MCGIAGIISNATDHAPRSVRLTRMMKLLERRGPDAEGQFHEGRISLGHRRLSILDTSDLGLQPMASHDNRYQIVFNGEIYNFKVLRQELEQRGHRFRSGSDTEMILAAFAEWSTGCFKRFNGMFALAIYDSKERKITLARDRYGKKPLYLFHSSSKLVFASTVNAVIAGLDESERPSLDPAALVDYLACGYALENRTVVQGITRVGPGTIEEYLLEPQLNLVAQTQFYDLEQILLRAEPLHASEREIEEQFELLLEDSVKARLISDRPLGLFLSGGVDSSTICALAKRLIGTEEIHTFCCAFGDQEFSEDKSAKRTAEFLGLKLHIEKFPEPTFESLQGAILSLGEPIGDSSYIPMEYLCRQAKGEIDVVLSGDGGDELLGGYTTFRATELAKNPLINNIVGRATLATLAKVLPIDHGKVSLGYKLRAFSRGLSEPFPVNHFSWRLLASISERAELMTQSSIAYDHPERSIAALLAGVNGGTNLRRAQYLDLRSWLPNDILPKVDFSGMAHGLEIRCPFLDYRLFEFCASLPESFLRAGGEGKVILKRIAQKLLPSPTIQQRKQGFNAPVNRWLAGPLSSHVAEIFQAAPELSNGLIQGAPLIKILKEHIAKKRDAGFFLWSMMVYLLWTEKHLNRR